MVSPMNFETYYNFWEYRMGYSMDTDKLCFCIVDDENERGVGFTSATVPDLNNFFCALDKPRIIRLSNGTYEIRIIFCHAEEDENGMTQYIYWYDIYIFNPADFSVAFQAHQLFEEPKEDF